MGTVIFHHAWHAVNCTSRQFFFWSRPEIMLYITLNSMPLLSCCPKSYNLSTSIHAWQISRLKHWGMGGKFLFCPFHPTAWKKSIYSHLSIIIDAVRRLTEEYLFQNTTNNEQPRTTECFQSSQCQICRSESLKRSTCARRSPQLAM